MSLYNLEIVWLTWQEASYPWVFRRPTWTSNLRWSLIVGPVLIRLYK
jgi:hypothetical protein